MKIFFGLNRNGLWYVTDKMPEKESYFTIHATSMKDAEAQLFDMIA